MFTFLVSDYYATGEGRTVSVLVTRSYLFEDKTYGEPDGKTPLLRKVEMFANTFDSWYARGMEELTKHEFEEKYMWIMPEMVYKLLNEKQPPGFSWHSQVHMNFA